jgi:hypothetical protein
MLEDDGFVLVGRITLQLPSSFLLQFDRPEARSWAPVIYAFRIGGEVVRIGKSESALSKRMNQWQTTVSDALAGEFQKGGTNPWETFEWRKRLQNHGQGELLALPTEKALLRRREKELIRRYDPPLCNDSPCARQRRPEAKSVKDVAAAKAYWQDLNRPS